MSTQTLVDLEYTVIGSMLYNIDTVGEIMTQLNPMDFSQLGTRDIFTAIGKLHFSGAPIDRVSVLLEVGDDYGEVFDAAFLRGVSNVGYYVDAMRQASRFESVKAEGMRLAMAETMEGANAVMDRLNGLLVSRQKVEVMSATQAAADFYERQGETTAPEYLKWGFEKLDEHLYAQLGDFVVVGGYPSAGKTLLSIQFALKMAERYSVGYFSLETRARKLIDRLMSHMGQVPLPQIKRRALDGEAWARVADASTRLSKMKLDFIEAGGMTVRDIQAQALSGRYQVIFVDYLQLITDTGHNRYEQVTNISKALHTLACAHGIAVIALAQLARPEKTPEKQLKPPTMSSFRESGQIEQDADIAFLLWPSDPNDNSSHRILKVGKNKEGERLKLELDFDGKTQTLKLHEPTISEKYAALHAEIKRAGRAAPAQVTMTELVGEDEYMPSGW